MDVTYLTSPYKLTPERQSEVRFGTGTEPDFSQNKLNKLEANHVSEPIYLIKTNNSQIFPLKSFDTI